MNEEVIDFDRWCKGSWSTTTRNSHQLLAPDTQQIRNHVDFARSSSFLKVHIAEKLILESCSGMGGFVESGDVRWFIGNFGRELQTTGIGFEGRRLQPLRAALLLTARSQFSAALPPERDDTDHIFAGGGALAAMYLLAQVEFLSRVLGRYLNRDGTIRRKIPHQLKKKADFKYNPKKVNGIQQAFAIYLYRNTTPVGKRLQTLENKLGIAKRLKRIRHPVMHGELADPAVEAWFLALLIAIFYYGAGEGPG